jgi:hypothetical protein
LGQIMVGLWLERTCCISWHCLNHRLCSLVCRVVLCADQGTSWTTAAAAAAAQGLGSLPSTGSQALDLLDLNTLGMFGLLSVVLLVPWNSGGIRSM